MSSSALDSLLDTGTYSSAMRFKVWSEETTSETESICSCQLDKAVEREIREEEFSTYRRMCFNVFAHNRDDHARNFSWIYDERMDCWHPSPAYDLTWSTTYFGEHTTTVDGNGRDPGRKELLAVGKAAGMSHNACKGIVEEIYEKSITLEKKYSNMRS